MKFLIKTFLFLLIVVSTKGSKVINWSAIRQLPPDDGIDEPAVNVRDMSLADFTTKNCWNGNITIPNDIDESVNLKVTKSAVKKGSYWHKISAQQWQACEFLKTTFRTDIQPLLKGKTDFPNVPEEGLCPIPKGTYYLDCVDPHVFDSYVPDYKNRYKYDANFINANNQGMGGPVILVSVQYT